jgi:NAD(P)-dependent dehydrogenase (short-subunit alcohol dehydrogenase family)
MAMVDRLKGRIIIVTGGGSGIGRAAAYCFCRDGAQVVVADINAESGEETVRKIREGGGDAIFAKCDVSNAQEVRAMVDKCVDTFGGLNCAFNNAGIEGIQAPTAEYSEEVWDKAIHVNLIGVYLCMKYEIPVMLKSGGGSIVNMSSILGLVGFAGASAYVAAKHGVVGLTKTAAIEYATKGIRVNAVCPGFIATPMLERGGITTNPELMKYVSDLHPMKRLGRPEEVAESVIWLFTDAASFVTGTILRVDGGYVSQ